MNCLRIKIKLFSLFGAEDASGDWIHIAHIINNLLLLIIITIILLGSKYYYYYY